MFKIVLVMFSVFLTQSVYSQTQDGSEETNLIRLVAALDEPEFYCVDLAGWGKNIKLDDPLQAHTCKVNNAADQMFSTESGKIKASDYDRCLQVAGSSGITLTGSAVLARACDQDNPLQKITLTESGKLQITGTEYCLTAGADSAEASGPSHVWRSLSTIKCDLADDALATWQIGLN